MEDFKNAYEYQVQHDKFAEKYSEEVNKRQQMELEVQYEADKKKTRNRAVATSSNKITAKGLKSANESALHVQCAQFHSTFL